MAVKIRFDPDVERPSVAVIEAVASIDGLEPLALTPPLYARLDPEALDTVLAVDDVRVAFTYRDHRIVVEGRGTIAVTPAETSAPRVDAPDER